MAGWIELFRSLGEALLEVWRAELATLQDDFQRSGRHLAVMLGLLGAVLILMFWIVGLLLFFLIALLYVWLPLWGAALIVLGLFAVTAGVLAWLGWRRWRQVENPIGIVQRRMDNHLDWWQHGLLAHPQALDVEPVPDPGEPLGRDLP
jgi:putative superfamily III holin-X